MPTLDEVYRKFGEVAEAAQLLETELGTIKLCAEGVEHDLFAGDKGDLATQIYNKINKSTLGQLAKAASVSGDLERRLANALAERNQLFHSFYRKHNFRRNSDEGRAKMLEDLAASTRQFSKHTRRSCDFRELTWISWQTCRCQRHT
jgi:hypothetical protein